MHQGNFSENQKKSWCFEHVSRSSRRASKRKKSNVRYTEDPDLNLHVRGKRTLPRGRPEPGQWPCTQILWDRPYVEEKSSIDKQSDSIGNQTVEIGVGLRVRVSKSRFLCRFWSRSCVISVSTDSQKKSWKRKADRRRPRKLHRLDGKAPKA